MVFLAYGPFPSLGAFSIRLYMGLMRADRRSDIEILSGRFGDPIKNARAQRHRRIEPTPPLD